VHRTARFTPRELHHELQDLDEREAADSKPPAIRSGLGQVKQQTLGLAHRGLIAVHRLGAICRLASRPDAAGPRTSERAPR
jgi:hypothetical protein